MKMCIENYLKQNDLPLINISNMCNVHCIYIQFKKEEKRKEKELVILHTLVHKLPLCDALDYLEQFVCLLAL